MKQTFTAFAQKDTDCIGMNIETIIFNLLDFQVEELISDYIKKNGELQLTKSEEKALNIYLDLKI